MKHEILNPRQYRNSKQEIQKSFSYFGFLFVVCVLQFVVSTTSTVSAQVRPEYSDPTSSSFRIVVCDGPTLPDEAPAFLLKKENDARRAQGLPDYVPCDFRGLMLQVQHLINIMMVLGVFASIAMFSWAGWLYISGVPANKTKAHAIFPKIFVGFIIMLSSWFIVYQILSWLTTNPGLKTLLGTP